MSTKRKSPKPPSRLIDPEKSAVIAAYSRGSLRTLDAIRNGAVDEGELDKLHNFFVSCLIMIELVPLAKFREAQAIAYGRSLVGTGIDVILDPNKTGI